MLLFDIVSDSWFNSYFWILLDDLDLDLERFDGIEGFGREISSSALFLIPYPICFTRLLGEEFTEITISPTNTLLDSFENVQS